MQLLWHPSAHDFPLKEGLTPILKTRENFISLFSKRSLVSRFSTRRKQCIRNVPPSTSLPRHPPPLHHPIVRLPRNSLRRKGNFLESYVDAAILTHFRSLIDVCVLRRCRKRRLFPLWAPAWAGKTTFGKHRLLSCNHKLG